MLCVSSVGRKNYATAVQLSLLLVFELFYSANENQSLLDTDYEVVREADRGVRKSDLKPKDGCGKIIGTVAVCVKDDPDMKDPPGSFLSPLNVSFFTNLAQTLGSHIDGVDRIYLSVFS